MNDHEYNELREASWSRKLTPAEEAEIQAHLAAHPGVRGEWEEEVALTALLREGGDAPLSSNFTSRVMVAVDLEVREQARGGRRWAWRRWLRLPRVGWAVMVAGVIFVGTQFYQRGLEADVQVMVEALPPEPTVVLADFDAIRVPVVEMDEDLWVALNQ